MKVGIDSFTSFYDDAKKNVSSSERLRRLVEQIEFADHKVNERYPKPSTLSFGFMSFYVFIKRL
jgi:hypothetical protein